ncbi:hypothetical protein BB560_004693 [Smittium megazygosporum]|uniref:Integrase zinc-binding domain-containing protein n=1 Tax=Smittium megazygosporum TaxID=133381 RepID=A0A2T9Z8I9_9FUNG|nr:hypothetical protein BB560_004693 [Smittium megazygosporum]
MLQQMHNKRMASTDPRNSSREKENFEIHNGQLFRKLQNGTTVPYIGEDNRKELVKAHHIGMAHLGVGAALTKFSFHSKHNWDLYLPQALWSTRIRTHRITGVSPYFLVYGKEPVIPGDVSTPEEITAKDENNIWNKESERIHAAEKGRANEKRPFQIVSRGPFHTYKLTDTQGRQTSELVHHDQLRKATLENNEIPNAPWTSQKIKTKKRVENINNENCATHLEGDDVAVQSLQH